MRRKAHSGLTFNYILPNDKKIYHFGSVDICEFINMDFPKNDNVHSPKYETEIFNIKFRMIPLEIQGVKNLADMMRFLRIENNVRKLMDFPVYQMDKRSMAFNQHHKERVMID